MSTGAAIQETGTGDGTRERGPVAGAGRASLQAPCPTRIESVGLKLPEKRLTTQELMESCRHRHGIDLERLVGIRERRIGSEADDSFTLAVDAAWDCLSHSRYQPEDMEMLISCSITAYEGRTFSFEPSLSFQIKESIGASRALHFDVRNACAGMMTGLYILNDFISRGVVRRGMVVSGERCSGISDNAAREVRWILSDQLASLTVGDSGAALILERNEGSPGGIRAFEMASYAEHADLCVATPCTTAHGFNMRTKAQKLHKVAIASAHPTILRSLEKAGLDMQEIDWLIPHQTSARAIRAGTRNIAPLVGGVPKNIVYNVREYGNTATTTHSLALHTLLQEGRFQTGDQILFLIFASGVVCGSMIMTMDELGESYGRDH